MSRRTQLTFIAIGFQFVSLVGCGKSPSSDLPYTSTSAKIGSLVSDMDDFAQSPSEIEMAVPRLFAPGCEPSEKDLPRYADYHYEGKPPIQNGDTATIVVVVKGAKTDSLVGEFTWSAKKVKDAKRVFEPIGSASAKGESAAHGDKEVREIWKLTDAPLPAK